MKLTIVAIDLRNQEQHAVAVDQLNEAGLLERCLIVDLNSFENWVAAWPGELHESLDVCLQVDRWTKITVISIRDVLEELHPTQTRVHAENKLLEMLKEIFPALPATSITGVTLSQFGKTVCNAHFPASYAANFLHEPLVEIDPRLPLIPLTEENRGRVLTFTGLTLTSGGKWATQDFMRDLRDYGDDERSVRLVRVVSRIAICPPLVGDTIRYVVRPGGGGIPLDAGPVVPVDSRPELIKRLSDQFISNYRLNTQPFAQAVPERESVKWFAALRALIADLPKYLRSAAKAEWRDRVDAVTLPLKERLGAVVFGEGSRFYIDGVALEGSSEAMMRLADELKERLEGLDGVVTPIATPELWSAFIQTSFSLLDVGEYPEGIDAPSSGGKVLFLNPDVVGPSLEKEFFELSKADCDTLELESREPRSVGLFQYFEADTLGDEIKVAAAKTHFRGEALEKKRELEKKRKETRVRDFEESSRLRGTLSRVERISKSREEASESDASLDLDAVRTPREIETDFETWNAYRKSVSVESFVSRLYAVLNKSVSEEFEKLKYEELLKEAEALGKIPVIEKSNFRKIFKIFGILLAVLLVAAFLISNVFGLVLSIIGIPLMLFVGIGWLLAFGFSLVRGVVKRALAMRRWDLDGVFKTSLLTFKYRALIHAINEFRRLEAIRMQFADWQLVVRELCHNPYGNLREDEYLAVPLKDDEIPPQLVIAKVTPNREGRRDFFDLVHQRLKNRGFLSMIEVELQDLWTAEYIEARVGVSATPFLDLSSPNLRPGKIFDGREYLFPRRDYVTQGVKEVLRRRLLAKRTLELDESFLDLSVNNILGSVDAGDAYPAHRESTPLEFLTGITNSNGRHFSQTFFEPGAVTGDLLTHNLDTEKSCLEIVGEKIGDFCLERNDNRVLLGATRIDMSKKITAKELAGFKSSSDPGFLARESDGPKL